MPHAHDCPRCAALAARTTRWRETGHLDAADLDLQEEHIIMTDYAPPLSYKSLEAKKTDTSTTTTSEDKYKAERMRALEATRATLDALPPPRFTAAEELKRYTPPNPYKALDRLKE